MKKIMLGALALAGAQGAHAVDIQAGDWTVSVGGIINAYYTTVSCSGDTVGGLALASEALGCSGEGRRTTIGNGLLPNALITSAKSKQGNYDVGGTIGIMVHTATDSGVAANNGVDVRQAFMTVGNSSMGTVKLGRDYGIFGSNAILSDMTLLGAGAPVQATQRGRVTLGHIGSGYTYLGTYGQIAYSSPKASNFGFDVALVSPVDVGTTFRSRTAPQLQAQVAFGSAETFKTWIGGKTQKFYSATDDFQMRGVELGASYNMGPLGLLANVQTGKGLGILTDGDQGDVKSRNYFVQATFKATDKMKFGAGYGQSRNREGGGLTAGLRENRNLTLGSYYSLTKSVTLVGEVGQTRSEAFTGAEARMKGASVGAILFF